MPRMLSVLWFFICPSNAPLEPSLSFLSLGQTFSLISSCRHPTRSKPRTALHHPALILHTIRARFRSRPSGIGIFAVSESQYFLPPPWLKTSALGAAVLPRASARRRTIRA
ncbi:hypothetical protein B0H16DRAFT_131513 [Mycena metata]|uniref:Uncharacterized protein n=1 Tax=Mycena metata TaxID=1033252 RepID=A0AAD7I6G9_9AGAR|nr:hypothetical protein B0H16DRAFT_131513 [Mycena metata]